MELFIRYSLLLLYSLFSFLAHCQSIGISKDWYYISIDKSNSRSISHIFDIHQDSEGFLYFSTNQGLYRYDGFHFEFLNEHINHYLGGSHIRFDKKGHLYYENFDGHLYTYQNKQWKRINKHKPVHFLFYGLFDQYITCVQPNGLDIYNLEDYSLNYTIPYAIGYPQYATQTEKYFYLINQTSLAKFDQKRLIQEFKLASISNKDLIRQLYIYNNKIYIVPRSEYSSGISVLSTDLKYLYTFPLDKVSGIINHIQFLDDKIWVLTTSGIYMFEEQNQTWIFKRHHFEGQSVSNIIKGHKGEYWISTIGKGLYLIPNPHQYVFKLTDEKLSQIIPTKDGYLAGTLQGTILKIDNQFHQAKVITNSKYQSPIVYLHQSDRHNEIFYVSGAGFNYLSKNGLHYFEKALKSVTPLDSNYYALATSSDILLFRSAIAKASYSIWDTLYQQRKENEHYASLVNGKRSKSVAYAKNQNRIYFLTNVGLFYIDEHGREHEVSHQGQSIICEKMQEINGDIYLLKYNGELWQYNHKEFKPITQIHYPVLDFKGHEDEIILKTEKAFELYDTKSKRSKILKTTLQTQAVNDFTYDNAGHIIASTQMGIVPLQEDIKEKMLDITSFRITKISVNGKMIDVAKRYQLAHHENNIQLQYAFLDYSNPNTPTFAYRINQGNWETLPADNQTLQFHELAPGSYTIDFKLDNETILNTVHLVIHPPFWQTWLFYTLITLLTSILIIIYFNHKRKILNKEIKLLEDKVALERELGKSILTSVKAQMNPHFFFNALNSIQAFIYKNDAKQAISYLSKFSKLTRLILTQTDVDLIRLADEINMLKLYLDLETVRFNHRFSYNLTIDKDIDSMQILLPAMLIQPYIENCIKHGFLQLQHEGLIELHFSLQEQILVVRIADNGIGRKRAKELQPNNSSSSFASKANQKRLEILNKSMHLDVSVVYKDLLNTKQEISGTEVTLYIPINFI